MLKRWPAVSSAVLRGEDGGFLGSLPIDHQVVPTARGGSQVARRQLRQFLDRRLDRYADEQNQPEADACSGLSPYLHFGHVSAHEVLHEVARHEDWTPEEVATTSTGKREGWWGMSAAAEAFLDQLVTWRELGYGFCFHRPEDYHRYDALPEWAQATLDTHRGDPREHVYDLQEFEAAKTHDPLWNAAQQQLLQEGRIHNYLRMLWGKKILEWSPDPETAAEVMIELNNKYALDGRNPNSYSGIFWTLGRFDRPWPERPIFGRVRYMSSANTARKLKVRNYVQKYQGEL